MGEWVWSRSRVTRRDVLGVVATLLLSMTVLLGGANDAGAEEGDTLRHFVADVPPCSVSTGIAFDGKRLYLSCWGAANLYAIDPADGSRLATIPVSGLSGIGALAWDGTRQKMWACDSSQQSVHLITMSGIDTSAPSAVAERRFTPQDGCIDGLAYDGIRDTLFTSGDVRSVIYHYDTAGQLLDTRDVSNSLGGCGSSGIAIGGGDLFLANNGCSQIYRVDADRQDAVPTLFATFPRRIEDMECDDRTFSTPDTSVSAIWAQDAYDAEIYAFDLGEGNCGYGGLPPDDEFVTVALGDSYQSGEGVGNSIADDATYLTEAYENGSNYPEQVGAQEDTYTHNVSDSGNSCHRALENYAKLNRTRLEIETNVVLIDETCSGATIEPGGEKPAIVGTEGAESFDPSSQVAQAIARLEERGLTAEDVDFVTVGMGGNDAQFGKIVQACVLPSLVQKLVDAYPNPPGDLGFAGNNLNCWLLSRFNMFNADDAIAALPDKEVWAQGELLEAFPNARIMQLTYPSILPSNDEVAEWCGGIKRSDLDFTRRQAARINDAVITNMPNVDDRFEFLSLYDAFGPNPLCPSDSSQQFANGISGENVEGEIARLLNLNGDGDAEARRLLDVTVAEYVDYRNCLVNWPAEGWTCDRGPLNTALGNLFGYMEGNLDQIFANVITPGAEGDTLDVALDRSRGLFHPNAKGFEVMACRVRSAYHLDATGDCLANPDRQPPRVNGDPFGLLPFELEFGDTSTYEVPGFSPNSPVHITYYSDEVDLGTVMADASGTVHVDLTVPDAGPGVHRLQFAGVAAGGSERVVEARIDVGGDPVPGKNFGTYLCCFTAALDETKPAEEIEVSYAGFRDVMIPDARGGILLDVIVPDSAGQYELTVKAVSKLTGQQIVRQLVEGPQVSEWGVDVTVPPKANAAQAGRAIPIDFRIRDPYGNPLEDPARIGLRSARVDCSTLTTASEPIPTETAGESDLRYRGDGWWKYVWKTNSAWKGTCRDLIIEVDQGASQRLLFDFR